MPPSFSSTRNVWSRYEQECFNIIRITWQGKQIIHRENIDKHDPRVNNGNNLVSLSYEVVYFLTFQFE